MKTALGLQAVEVDEAVEVGGAERTLLKALELGVNSGRCRVRCSSRCCWEEWRVRWQSQYSRSAAPCYPPLFPEYFRLGDTITRDKAEAWQQGARVRSHLHLGTGQAGRRANWALPRCGYCYAPQF